MTATGAWSTGVLRNYGSYAGSQYHSFRQSFYCYNQIRAFMHAEGKTE